MREVWSALARLVESGGEGALVTIVDTAGSAYQREGAKMLYRESAEAVGTISGGCLEADLFEHCRSAIGAGEPRLVRYAAGSDRDILLGVGTGCQGTIELLIEPVANWRLPAERALLAEMLRRVDGDRRFALATLLRRGEGMPGRHLPRLLVDASGEALGAVEDRTLRDALLDAARAAVADGSRRPSHKSERICAESRCEIFIDVVTPPARLIVFGAGEDARPLVRIAAASGLRVTIADWRPDLLDAARFPEADARVCLRPEEFPGEISLAGGAALVLMSHNYLADRAVLERLLQRGETPNYLGVLGPRSRTARLLSEIAPHGRAAGTAEQIRTPAGLDIGADTPQEIALSIVAEILAVRRRRSGRALRETSEPAAHERGSQR